MFRTVKEIGEFSKENYFNLIETINIFKFIRGVLPNEEQVEELKKILDKKAKEKQ